jgi:hypothetical protein
MPAFLGKAGICRLRAHHSCPGELSPRKAVRHEGKIGGLHFDSTAEGAEASRAKPYPSRLRATPLRRERLTDTHQGG